MLSNCDYYICTNISYDLVSNSQVPKQNIYYDHNIYTVYTLDTIKLPQMHIWSWF